ncbi:MAG: 4-hydroxythreonine-4-phosphate dehydrogenase PdxA [Desulfuromonadales bacterium]
MKPLLITMGDPTGIGPEIVVRALLEGRFDTLERPLVVVGDVAILQRAARLFGREVDVIQTSDEAGGLSSHVLRIGSRRLAVRALSALSAKTLKWGHPDEACGRAMAEYIIWACDRCLDGQAAGMVTAPINKAAIRKAGYRYAGHTELLAERCGTTRVVMMLAGPRLRVCLATTHLALRDVPATLTSEGILETIRIAQHSLRRFCGLESPRLAVLGLNPHSGEQGMFGDEEDRLIRPAIETARAEGVAASGPHSADTLFHFAARGDYDAVVCMYHDQGLIPLKLLHFDDAVNVTLGLPIVRTSVDHGTAYDLAGTGQASPASLVAAVSMATEMTSKENPRF